MSRQSDRNIDDEMVPSSEEKTETDATSSTLESTTSSEPSQLDPMTDLPKEFLQTGDKGDNIESNGEAKIEESDPDQDNEKNRPFYYHLVLDQCVKNSRETDGSNNTDTFFDGMDLHNHIKLAHPDVPIIPCGSCNDPSPSLRKSSHNSSLAHRKPMLMNFKRRLSNQQSRQPNISGILRRPQRKHYLQKYRQKPHPGVKSSNIQRMYRKRKLAKILANRIDSTMSLIETAENQSSEDGLSKLSTSDTVIHQNESIINMDLLGPNESSRMEDVSFDAQLNETPLDQFLEKPAINDSVSTCINASIDNSIDNQTDDALRSIQDEAFTCDIADHIDTDFAENICDNVSIENCNDFKIDNSVDVMQIEVSTCPASTSDLIESRLCPMTLDPSTGGITNNAGEEVTADSITQSVATVSKLSKPCKTYQVKLSQGRENTTESSFCFMCEQIFSIIEQKRMKAANKESVLRCPLCSTQFTMRYLLKKHIAHGHLNCDCVKEVPPPVKATLSIFPPNVSELYICKPAVEPKYCCSYCMRTFNRYENLNNHILTLHELRSPLKEKPTTSQPEYLRNLKSDIVQSKPSIGSSRVANSKNTSAIRCVVCAMRFSNCATYISHVKEYHKDWKFDHIELPHSPCEESTDSTNMEAIIEENQFGNDDLISIPNISSILDVSEEVIKMDSVEEEKTCRRCNQEFKSLKDLNDHCYFVHDDSHDPTMPPTHEKRNNNWRCRHCEQHFKTLQSYIRHRYFVHNDESMVHICENCSKIITSVTTVNVHVCLNVSSWTCKSCDEIFPNGMALRLHNNDKHIETPGPHICTMCEKRFLTKAMLQRHARANDCYLHIRPLDSLTNSLMSTSNDRTQQYETLNIKPATPPKKTLKLDNLHINNSNYAPEDVFVSQDSETNDVEPQQKPNSHYPVPRAHDPDEDNEIYRCTLCRLDFMSRLGLKTHLTRVHASAVEICQLCYRMVSTGALVRHMINVHLPRDNGSPSEFPQMKQEEALDDEQAIEKDTEELIQKIGKFQLLSLCEYNRFTEYSNLHESSCPYCPLKFNSCAKYRRHNVQMHDKMCALCNIQFESGPEAAQHKTHVHGSIACYIWFAQKVVLAIEDTQTFRYLARKMIVEAGIQRHDAIDDDIEETINATLPILNELNNDQSNIIDEDLLSFRDESQEEICPADEAWQEPEKTDEVYTADVPSNDTIEVDDEQEIVLIVTEEDLEKYRDNISELTEQIGVNCNISISKDITKMLESFVNSHLQHE